MHQTISFQKGDFFGGITAGIVALPLALAFGVQSGLGAEAGLYGAIFLGIVASIFGGTPSQISGPTGPMTVVTAALVANILTLKGSLEAALGLILLTFILAGTFQIILGMLKAGRYIRYIPYPVLSGFMSGIGVIIILLQLFPLIGLQSPSSVVDVVLSFPVMAEQANIYALALAGLTILIIYLFPLLTKAVPGTLVALVLVSLLNYFAGFQVPMIGEIAEGLPVIRMTQLFNIHFSDIFLVLVPALSLAALGSLDTLLTSVVADNVTKTKHNSNKELMGQGIGNMVAGLFGGIPGAGATMRTMVNINSGGKNRISGVVHGILLLLILLGLGRYVAWIPFPVLAGILITVGISIIDRKGLTDLFLIPRSDAVTLVVVLLLTVFLDLLQAVGAGMIIASVLFMKRAGDLVESGTHLEASTVNDKEIPWDDESGIPSEILRKIYIQRLDGPVFFGAVTRFQHLMSNIPEHVDTVIIRMKKVPYVDQSGLYAIEAVVRSLQEKGITVVFTIIQPQVLYMFRKVNLIPGLVLEEHCFETFEECATWLKNQHQGNNLSA